METQPTIIIKARIEEVPTIARFTLESFRRDATDFQTYKPLKYPVGFDLTLEGKIAAVAAVIFPEVLTGELKQITLRIFSNMMLIRPLMDRLEGYVNDASPLTVSKKDFGISKVRQAITKDDQEGLDHAISLVLQNITNNFGALNAQGYTAGDKTALKNLQTAINADNVLQNVKEGARAQLVRDNIGLINDLIKDLKGVWADGKLLYKINNKTKAKDYTLTQLINRIRQEELQTKLTGVVFTLSGTPVDKKAKIVAKPLLGGRSKTVYSKDSKYVLPGLKPVPTLITVTLADGSKFVVAGEPKTRETVVLDLKPAP